MINVVFCGYRDWANFVFDEISTNNNINILHRINSYDDYIKKQKCFSEKTDLILFIGWSWIVTPEVTDKYLCLGIHPSDLPEYRGGSPIQNQIINGVAKSKVTLMTLSNDKLDAGDIWIKEDLDLTGNNIEEIFENISKGTIKLLHDFFNQFPNIRPVKQEISKGSYHKRRTPSQSLITGIDLKDKSLLELYDFIRCLTDPYPNAYIEDEEGNRLFIKEVEYVPKGA